MTGEGFFKDAILFQFQNLTRNLPAESGENKKKESIKVTGLTSNVQTGHDLDHKLEALLLDLICPATILAK